MKAPPVYTMLIDGSGVYALPNGQVRLVHPGTADRNFASMQEAIELARVEANARHRAKLTAEGRRQ